MCPILILGYMKNRRFFFTFVVVNISHLFSAYANVICIKLKEQFGFKILVRILSTKWTRISVKKVQTLQSTVLSRILLARDYEDIQQHAIL